MFYKHFFILPHYLLGIAWLMVTAVLAWPWFWLKKFPREQLFSFFQFQGRVVYALLRPVVNGITVASPNAADGRARFFVANHSSVMDAFVFAGIGVRRVVFVAKNWPFRIPFYGKYLRAAGFVNTDETDFSQLCEIVKQRLADGVSVVFFPEGGRHEKIARFHSLPFHVAVTVSADVTPVAISGHAEMLPPKCHSPRPAELRYTILPAVSVSGFAGDDGPLRMARQVRELIAAEL